MDPTNDHHELVQSTPSLLTKIRTQWQPSPLKAPEVDPDLPHLNGLQRALEALRYGFLSFERWMSPNGKLREYLRLHSILALLLLIPALVILPIIGFIVWQVAGMVSLLLEIAIKLILIPVLVLLGILIMRFLIRLLRKH